MSTKHRLVIVWAFVLTALVFAAAWRWSFPSSTAPRTETNGIMEEAVQKAQSLRPPATQQLKITVSGLPPMLYAGERRSLVVTVGNESEDGEECSIQFLMGGAEPISRKVVVAPESETVAVFPFNLPARPEAPLECCLHVYHEGETIFAKSFLFADGYGDLSGLHANESGFLLPDGRPVVLVGDYEDETSYRRWAPIKWAKAAWDRARAKRFVWGNPEFLGQVADTTMISYDGDPFSALLSTNAHLPDGKPAILILGWGVDEAFRRMPVEHVTRMLDLAIDRIRRHNASVRIVLLTPPPLVGEEDICGQYAAAIRTLAREHHAPVIDLHTEMSRLPDWYEFFRYDGDPAITSLAFSPEGRERISAWIAAQKGTVVPDRIEMPKTSEARDHPAPTEAVSVQCSFPGMVSMPGPMPARRRQMASVSFKIHLPADAPYDLKPAFYMKDKDGIWFQALPQERPRRGGWTDIHLDLTGESHAVIPVGHEAAWNRYRAERVVETGVRLFSASDWQGAIRVTSPEIQAVRNPQEDSLSVRHLRESTPTPKAYAPYEIAFEIHPQTAAPCDPDMIRVDAIFTTPSGKQLIRPCFFDQPCRRELGPDRVEIVTPCGRAGWRVRVTPTEAGKHFWQLRIRKGKESLETDKHLFRVAPGKAHGFVRVSDADRRYFETADGKWFYPIGENIHAPFDKRCAEMLRVPVLPNRGTYAYDDYFKKMAASGQNACVVWMSNWWVAIEWTDRWKGFGGLVDYHLENAWRLDQVFEAAARHGIYINLVLDNHGKTSAYVDSEWPTNPYNADNGGPCLRPEQFYTSPAPLGIFQKRLRYIVARWAHHPNLLGFEIVSELNLVGSSRSYKGDPSQAAWVRKVIGSLDEIDAYHRPVTVQYSNDWQSVDENVASLDGLDYLVGDAYKAGGSIVPLMVETAEKNTRFLKPTFSAEFGGNWNGTTPQRLHADLHAGLWANAMTNTAGAPFFWWFDFVDRYNLYSEYAALSAFMKGEDRRRFFGNTRFLSVMKGGETTRDLKALVLSGKRQADFWIYDALASEIMPEEKYARLHEGASIVVPDMEPGIYAVEFWDTRRGEVVQRIDAEATEQGLRLQAPPFRVDMAGKIRPVGLSAR